MGAKLGRWRRSDATLFSALEQAQLPHVAPDRSCRFSLARLPKVLRFRGLPPQ
jgi:hypothetical protein